MKDDFLLRQIIVYGTGVICICAWAILNVIPYAIAMYLASAIFAYSLFMEAQVAKAAGYKKKAAKKLTFCLILVVCIIAILILNP